MMLDPTRTSRLRTAQSRARARQFFRASDRALRHVPVESVEPRILFAEVNVTTTDDLVDGNVTSISALIANPGPTGISLREAMLAANATPNPAEDVDNIFFNLPGPGPVYTITPTSPLPTITDAVTIDATAEDLLTPTVELNGSQAGANANGFTITTSYPFIATFVAGFIINRFSGNGVQITGNSNGVGLSYIGTNAAGTAAGAGNGGHGILIQGSGNFASDNKIAFNALDGVAVVGATSDGNDVAINDFFQNGGLAIDLGNDGPTPNDAGDADAGPNGLQNYPVITVAAAPGGGVVVSGTINSTPNTDFDVAIYASPTNEGEGQTFLTHFHEFVDATGQTRPVRTDASGNVTFTRTLPDANPSHWYTATATELIVITAEDTFAISTSEMSPPVTVGGATPRVTNVFARGSTWLGNDNNANNTTFMELLQNRSLGSAAYGFRIPDAPTGNENLLPWINVNQLILEYDVALTAAPVASSVIVDGSRRDYQVTTALLDPTHVLVTLDQPLGGSPATTATNGDRFLLTVNGAGQGGGNYQIRFNVLQGDVNRSASVLANDYSEVKSRFFQNTNQPVYSPFHDVDGNGSVLANDYSAVKARFFHNLPSQQPMSAADGGVTKDLFSDTTVL